MSVPRMMVRLGLTGSIGMGKSTTAQLFREAGIPVHDADATVHRLYEGRALPLIAATFPETMVQGKVDRNALGARVLKDPDALARLEALIHPLVREEEEAFLNRVRARLVILDIPLLFETDADRRCDAIVVVSAPESVQRDRVLARPGMIETRFHQILDRQMPDCEKRRRAHFIVYSHNGLDSARRQVQDILRALTG
jgi:dephospho-CoA kinase